MLGCFALKKRTKFCETRLQAYLLLIEVTSETDNVRGGKSFKKDPSINDKVGGENGVSVLECRYWSDSFEVSG